MSEVEQYSNLSSSMRKIYEAHWETGNEVGSKNGFAIADATRKAMRSKTTRWRTEYKDGKKRLILGASARPIGERVEYGTGRKLKTKLHNMVQWRTYSTTGTTVVAGMMKSGRTEIRENGQIVSTKRVDGVSKESIAILKKLDSGNQGDTTWLDEKTGRLSRKSNSRFEGKWKGFDFISEGRRNALPIVDSNIRTGFGEGLKRREKNTKQRMERVS